MYKRQIFSTSTDLPAWASTYQLDPVPHPDASFTTMRDALGLRVSRKDTGEAVDLMVDAILMAHPAAPAAALLDTPYQYTLVPGELYEGPNMEPVSYTHLHLPGQIKSRPEGSRRGLPRRDGRPSRRPGEGHQIPRDPQASPAQRVGWGAEEQRSV